MFLQSLIPEIVQPDRDSAAPCNEKSEGKTTVQFIAMLRYE
jgi:hypothetical protein